MRAKDVLSECLMETLLIILAILVGLGIWIGQSAMEAATFNKFTTTPITTWDAMWGDFKIINK